MAEEDVRNPDVAFRPADTPTTTPKARPKGDQFRWPTYGYSAERTRELRAPDWLRPPFRQSWKLPGSTLFEFPPVLARDLLFITNKDAALFAVDKDTGDVRWKRALGFRAASSPAAAGGLLVATTKERDKGSEGGSVVAVSQKTGRTVWQRNLPSWSESSPVIADGTVYLGSQDGTVYALRLGDGKVKWTYDAPGPVKSGLALANGKLFFGAYGGTVHAVRAKDGSEVWSVSTSGDDFGLGSGDFYSTPAVAFGRVYIGNTDAKMYSFSTEDGELAWTKTTGDAVYSSPAVADVDGLGPTVIFGSNDGTLYAVDARSGDERWTHDAGGRIMGAPTIVGRIVYFANLDSHLSFALGLRTGRNLGRIGRGGYTPVISDGRRIYLTGYSNLYRLDPRRTP